MKIKLTSLIFCFVFASNVFAQTGNISLNMQSLALQDVFKNIQDKSGYRFFYNDDLVDLQMPVSLIVRNVEIQEVIDELKSQTNLTFRIMEKNSNQQR